MKWTVTCFEKEYEVSAETPYFAKKKAAILYNKDQENPIKIAFLILNCTVKSKSDRRFSPTK